MNEEAPYQPIDCGLHSEYEWLAMHQAEVVLVCETTEGEQQQLRGRVLDVFTRQGAEYLRLESRAKGVLDLRLDHIREISA
ncbi:hypothetical protein [Thiolapillus brandeum]|uniref:Transcriptional antiterminator, Rof n=1 Tax=Thiolapillus brandeum TaxID=1076588 RepID=A0A7U6JFP6_9GAMM|nr:hypothetical protein [Thiolapillus brandeum]BAO43104.1 conserved hypothetical protein [Thiolapillus brandeum]